jgi:hypothetical protein
MPVVNVHRYATEGLEPAILTAMQTYQGDITFTDTVAVTLTSAVVTGPGTWALYEASGGSIIGYVPGRVTVTVPSGYTASNVRKNLNRILVTIT